MAQPPSPQLYYAAAAVSSMAISTESAMNARRTSTPPKLGLCSLRNQRPGYPPGLATPPHRGAPVSVPFLWEEAPGKPRELRQPAAATATTAARSLGLPPRLLAAKMQSPRTVLDGPDLYGSFREGRTRKKREGLAWFWKRKEKGSDSSSSSSSVASSSPSFSSCRYNYVFINEGGDGAEEEEFVNSNLRITRLRRKGSFANIGTSHILGSIYGGIKQVIAPLPWRRDRKNLH